MNTHSGLHGATLTSEEVGAFVERIVGETIEGSAEATPVCIWGVHGIGKTALVEAVARRNRWRFAYAAPAQFEEMGDLHGLPVIEGGATRFAPPDWVPTDPGPGILLLDDFNRADDRILRGLMQLLQRNELVSWSLPEGWHIVTTANPEGHDYSVTPLDDAMLTRMLHVSMEFEPAAWARWAVRAGVDERGIAFVLAYPEIVTGRRTTPRSLTQFFAQIQRIDDLAAERHHVHALALSALDEETAAAFSTFVRDGVPNLLTPRQILDDDSTTTAIRVAEFVDDDSGKRLDRLNAVIARLVIDVGADAFAATDRQAANIVAFLKHDAIPNDLRVMAHRDLLDVAPPILAAALQDPDLAAMTLDAL